MTTTSQRKVKKSFKCRCKYVLLQVILFGFTNISLFELTMLNCIDINGTHRLYVNGNILCYTSWQYVVWLLLFLWVIPFAPGLYYGTQLLRSNKIGVNLFLGGLLCPPLSLFQYLHYHYNLHHPTQSTNDEVDDDVDYGNNCNDDKTKILSMIRLS